MSFVRCVDQQAVRSNCSTPSTNNLDAAYNEAMASPNNDLKLLRLLQRTGPIIQDLAADTVNRVLCAFHTLLSEGTAVVRILPWLWQLAEPENASYARQVPDDMKQKLIDVIGQLCQDAPDHQVPLQGALFFDFLLSISHAVLQPFCGQWVHPSVAFVEMLLV